MVALNLDQVPAVVRPHLQGHRQLHHHGMQDKLDSSSKTHEPLPSPNEPGDQLTPNETATQLKRLTAVHTYSVSSRGSTM
eukprot:1146423-Pelagomonas_calceolata.AAC.9